MDPTAHTAAMVDFLVLRWGKNDAASRARLLGYLQAAEHTLCGLRAWWFLGAEEDIALTPGQSTYTLNHLGSIRWARVGNGEPLSQLAERDFSITLRPYVVSGVPKMWTEISPSGGNTRLEVWPVPDAAGQLKVDVKLPGGNVLEDSTASQSRIPPSWRMAVIYEAERLAALNDEQLATSQIYLGQRDQVLAALMLEDDEHRSREALQAAADPRRWADA